METMYCTGGKPKIKEFKKDLIVWKQMKNKTDSSYKLTV